MCFIKVIEGIALGILAARGDWKWWYQLVELVVISSLSPVVMLICYFFRHSDLVEGKIGGCGEKWDVEMWVSRLFQGLTFTLSYETMSYLAYKGFWKASDTQDWPEGGKLSIIICVLLFLQMINTYLLPLLQRTLTLKYALPPYVDEVMCSFCFTLCLNSSPVVGKPHSDQSSHFSKQKDHGQSINSSP